VLSLRVSRDKRGYDYIYLLLEARRRGRVENRLLYCGRWPAPCRVGIKPFDEDTRTRLQEAHPEVPFDWPALLKTLNAALGVSRPPIGAPLPPPSRSRRPGAGGPGMAPSGRPGAPYRQPVAPPMRRVPEHEPLPTEIVLVSAELEEQETTYAAPELEVQHEREPAPEFEPVCEADRPFSASIDLQLITDEIVHIHVPAPPPIGDAAVADEEVGPIPADGHVFTEASGPATFETEPHRRRRRRRGGRGRGKPADSRAGAEHTPPDDTSSE
jgi:hypothetical protein